MLIKFSNGISHTINAADINTKDNINTNFLPSYLMIMYI